MLQLREQRKAPRSHSLRRNGLGLLTPGRGVIGVALLGSPTRYMMEFFILLQDATSVASRATLREIIGSRLQLLESDFVTIVSRLVI